MRNTILIFAALMMAFAFTSCQKEDTGSIYDILGEARAAQEIVTLSTSDYERVETETLVQDCDHCAYKAGTIEYVEDGQVSATVEFGIDVAGNENENKFVVTDKEGDKGEYDYKEKKEGKYDKEKWEYEKVIVEPLVKADDCDYIVAGTIEFYEDGAWVATIDFGDGTCDNLAVKMTVDDLIEFELDK